MENIEGIEDLRQVHKRLEAVEKQRLRELWIRIRWIVRWYWKLGKSTAKELIATFFHTNISNEKLNGKEARPIGKEDSLKQLRYIIYKNLSLISSTYKKDLEESLNYLIKVGLTANTHCTLQINWFQLVFF